MKTLENSCQFLGTCPDTDKCDGYGSVKIILSRGRKKNSFCKSPKSYGKFIHEELKNETVGY